MRTLKGKHHIGHHNLKEKVTYNPSQDMSKKNPFLYPINRMQRFMDSVPGQTFLHYAYNWGAAIVILGALFKLTHIAGANFMLFLGMGTEFFVFFISAFDRPFDKTGEATVEEEFVEDEDIDEDDNTTENAPQGATITAVNGGATPSATMVGGSGTIVIGGGQAGTTPSATAPATTADVTDQIINDAISAAMPEGSEEANRLADIIRMANDELLRRTQAVLSPDMEAASQEYIQKLRTLTDTLEKVDEQSSRLTRDSQEMENLNRTLIGINKVYELHFSSISRQVTTIEQINEHTRELAAKIDEVNKIYSRMMQQLNIMSNPAAAFSAPAAPTAPEA